MSKQWIKNHDSLALNEQRKAVLDIIEAGLDAIDTETVIKDSVRLEGETLFIKDQNFNLKDYKRIFVIGFGKASCKAAFALENILGNRINDGVAIGLKPLKCEYIRTYQGTHPKPSEENVNGSQEIVNIGNKLQEGDLVITIVSGGGSALLCYPMSECELAQNLYESFLKTGGSIRELNTVRKHISHLKGGGLAKVLYPASVIGLIFSDLPGNEFSMIASGPTYKDTTTVEDAGQIIEKYGLGNFELVETPKEDKYFEKVINIPLVSNETALAAMQKKAEELNLSSIVLTSELYDDPPTAINRLIQGTVSHDLVLAGGEPSIKVTKSGGTGGRNSYMSMHMLKKIKPGMVFASVASDGLDNSQYAGVIEDEDTVKRASNLEIDSFIENFDGLGIFTRLGHELLETGPTEANVSDLLILYDKKLDQMD